ncbi:MAG TPA: hypothetical protein VE449_09545, partial [Thermoleophilaceae bacterium]|nr:hypothetical protein [Thermoleophilaceae bacterium]
MSRVRLLTLALAIAVVVPAGASAQTYMPGRLVDPGLVDPPLSIPAPPVGEYPEHWAECVAERNPVWPTAPAGIDPKAVDPASPNPLLGQR